MKLQRPDQSTIWIILGIVGFAWRCHAATLTLNESSTLKGPEWAELETKEYANPATPYSTRRILLPKPLTSLEGLKKLNPEIDQALPAIAELLKDAKLSERFAEMYHRKVLHIEGGHPLSAEDYFDCATILETTARGQKVILWQSRMDVDTDGSDPNRLSALEDYDPSLKDPWFQPLLSYRWIQKPATENPFQPRLRSTITALQKIHAALDSMPKPTEQIKKFDEKVGERAEGHTRKIAPNWTGRSHRSPSTILLLWSRSRGRISHRARSPPWWWVPASTRASWVTKAVPTK